MAALVPVILCGGTGTRLWPLFRITYQSSRHFRIWLTLSQPSEIAWYNQVDTIK